MDERAELSVLFVDDEERVLKSMRAMFRKEFNVLLANSGAEALRLLQDHDVDVVVSDQRMPQMTGVEVLREVKERNPACVRILLTGYADLKAVEDSLNEAEVSRYLMKPCPQNEIREAILNSLDSDSVETPSESVARPEQGGSERRKQGNPVGVMVLSRDPKLIEGVKEACPDHQVLAASDLDDALAAASSGVFGVLVTDRASSEKEVIELDRRLRPLVPQLVVILASDRSDASLLIQLINSGYVFRFLLKPLQVGQCKIWLRSAFKRFADRGGVALATLDGVVEPSYWARFKNWLLGVQT